MSDISYFDNLNKIIHSASNKFLSDIEQWRTENFKELKRLVDEYEETALTDWQEEINKWLADNKLTPDEQKKLPLDTNNWKYRTYLWVAKMKNEYVAIIYKRHNFTKEKLEIYKELGFEFMIPSTIEVLLKNIQNQTMQLHNNNITNEENYLQAIAIKEKIDDLFEDLESELKKAESRIDLASSDSSQHKLTEKIFEIRYILDDLTSAMNLTKTYFNWARKDPYIAEVIKYGDKLEYLLGRD